MVIFCSAICPPALAICATLSVWRDECIRKLSIKMLNLLGKPSPVHFALKWGLSWMNRKHLNRLNVADSCVCTKTI